eukprot:gnl/Spiro4/14408_TR7760_c0_g1_i1.p1 gnl/Spiro4/14408_TR7760_c0_g1~~gnl/Spiro4/14408_TR7760_c0_g1_i1.p1  ORF type:complete len:376 (+),score=75.31 gnl/Spiro4/14408_TR7760_c0_g1_i1:39-1166(+)
MPPKKIKEPKPREVDENEAQRKADGARLTKKAYDLGMFQNEAPTQYSVKHFSEAVRKCDGMDICKKSAKGHSHKFLFALPGTLHEKCGAGTIGTLMNLDTSNPSLILDTNKGRLKLNGTVVFPQSKFLSIAPQHKQGKLMCDGVFESVFLFSEAEFLGSADENPTNRRMVLPDSFATKTVGTEVASAPRETATEPSTRTAASTATANPQKSTKQTTLTFEHVPAPDAPPKSPPRARRTAAAAVKYVEKASSDEDDDEDDFVVKRPPPSRTAPQPKRSRRSDSPEPAPATATTTTRRGPQKKKLIADDDDDDGGDATHNNKKRSLHSDSEGSPTGSEDDPTKKARGKRGAVQQKKPLSFKERLLARQQGLLSSDSD